MRVQPIITIGVKPISINNCNYINQNNMICDNYKASRNSSVTFGSSFSGILGSFRNVVEKIKKPFETSLIDNFGTVVEGKLFRGALPTSDEHFAELQKRGVTFIIDLCGLNKTRKDEIKKRWGIDYFFEDGFKLQNDKNELARVADSIKEKIDKGGVGYIHCKLGSERTGLLVAYYQMTKLGLTEERIISDYIDHKGGSRNTILMFLCSIKDN